MGCHLLSHTSLLYHITTIGHLRTESYFGSGWFFHRGMDGGIVIDSSFGFGWGGEGRDKVSSQPFHERDEMRRISLVFLYRVSYKQRREGWFFS